MPVLESERLILRLGDPKDIDSIIHYFTVNQAYLQPFEPQRPDNFLTPGYWAAELEARRQDAVQKRSLKLFIFEQAAPAVVIGAINLNNMIWGVFQAATLGYSLAAAKQRQGYMSEAGSQLIRYGFEVLNLHRIMANYMPHNQRSANVLKRLGFEIEGTAKDYLFINGGWQDHVLTSRINPDWRLNHS
ncbi:Ribosomal-protein-alanine acetyltransferase [Halomicronema hongdechloris C2206]|uniref:Ribosomal-protein-alanine acetyltransferase n=2 Tax=Halomicronema hongdechloris TaxID=1209493 RepID=A0A1Z3HPP2_9CYAN|nr:Ribosomal-protein-alanine acetyltransferase [Halomicronema hongdechloris C2206]